MTDKCLDYNDEYQDCACLCHEQPEDGAGAPRPTRISRKEWKKRAIAAELDAERARAELKESGIVSIVLMGKEETKVLAGLNVTRHATTRWRSPTPMEGVLTVEAYMS